MSQTTSKTWFITGTSSGFGRLLTGKLLARGDRVVATVRQPQVLYDLQMQYDKRLMVVTLDVTDTDAVHRVINQAFIAMGRIDVVVNNAGYGLFGAAEELTDAQIRHQIDTNLMGSIQVIRAALPHLRNQGGGRILQVSSEGGQITYPNFSLYHATKWGIEGFIEAVAQEVAAFNIEFTIAEPGPAKTDFARGIVSPPAMGVYENTASGTLRNAFASGSFVLQGDPVKMAQAMIDAIDRNPAPKRLAMGSGAYANIRTGLLERLAALEAQKDIAVSTDVDQV